MRIHTLWLDGYGCFAGREIELSPGLHVIAGPNEQGKTTLRNFICDMLYGQKTTPTQRRYEDSNQLRLPWDSPETYGGRLAYVLDSGREIEISRSFERSSESIKVYDLTNSRDITVEFPVEKSQEPTFAQQHLGMGKKVFLSTANIGSLNLNKLGDNEALSQIRENLLSLTDSADTQHSAESTLKRLSTRITQIGQTTARTKPLPLARNRVAALEEERKEALALQQALVGIEDERQQLREQIEALRSRRAECEEQARVLEQYERADRLEEAEKIARRIDAITEQCFNLGSVRDFPLEAEPEIQRLENLVNTAQLQITRTRQEREGLSRDLQTEGRDDGGSAIGGMEELPEDQEQRLVDLDARIQRLRTQLDETNDEMAKVKERIEAAQAELAELPDFGNLSADPVEWLTQLSSAYSVAERLRDEEKDRLDRLEEEIEHRRNDLQLGEQVFAGCHDFPDRARRYESDIQVVTDKTTALRSQIENFEALSEEHRSAAPAHLSLAIICVITLIGLVAAAVLTGVIAVYLPAGFTGVALLWFTVKWAFAQNQLRRNSERIEQAQGELDDLQQQDLANRKFVEQLMRRANCQTLRELEAIYERYRQGQDELASLEEARDARRAEYEDAQERLTELFRNFRDTFDKLGDTVDSSANVPEATGRALSRYQEYRDAKRRISENRETLERYATETARLNQELEKTLKEEAEASLEIRRFMRENGYADEKKHDSALSAIRAYRIRSAQVRQRRGRVEVFEETAKRLDELLLEERAELNEQQKVLQERLESAGAESVAQWRELAEKARSYRELWAERSRLQERLGALLHEETIEELRQTVAAEAPLPPRPTLTVAELKGQQDAMAREMEDLSKEEHGLHLKLTEQAASSRSLNEIEEELAEVRGRLEDLSLEFEAASYAMAMIEEAAREKHLEVAPRLATLASDYITEVTAGRYKELKVSRDLELTVRLPENQTLQDDPEARLSTGTVDQIYLALRLALVQTLCEGGESVPMLLDDPFSNYDDARLENAICLLATIAQRSQILLFTCRADVMRAAQAVDAPVLSL